MNTGRRIPPPAARGGFTLVELLVVAVVAIIILAGVVRVLVSTQQVYRAQTARMESQQIVRAGMGILFGELREVSPAGGDLVDMQPNQVRIRAMRAVGYACQVTYGGNPSVTTTRLGSWFRGGDSIFVYADGDPDRMDDDVWLRGVTSAVDTTAACPDGSPGQRLTLAGWGATVNPVLPGAMVRSFEHVTYGLYQQTSGEWALGVGSGPGTFQPLVGPLLAETGGPPLFRYLNAAGNPTATATQVRQVEVTLRTAMRARGPGGAVIGDSITARIQARN